MSNEAASQLDIATQLLDEGTGELSIREQSIEAQDAHSDYVAAVNDTLAAGNQLESDLADLHSKRDLVPAAGLARLRGEAVAEAQSRADEAGRRADRAMANLRGALTDAALPKVDASREALARDEARIALGGAEGDKLVTRAMGIVQKGSPEAAGVIFSPFFRTLMAARGVSNPDQAMAQLRTVAAGVAPERGATETERRAGAALQKLGKLEAARTAAHLHVRRQP